MGLNNAKVSVVIPVYNVEKYLKQCLESVLNQTYKNLQVVLINDGSRDESGKICENYAQKDERVKCIHKENGGISAARNDGLKEIDGDYVLFVDSDDYIDQDLVETLLKEIDGFDVVASLTKYFNSSGVIKGRGEAPLKIDCLDNDQAKKAYMQGVIRPYFYGPVAKLYKTEIIKKNNILFDTELKVGEDIVFNLGFLRCCASAKVVDYGGYNVRVNETSTTNSLARKYTPMYEHDYSFIQDKIAEAGRKWGFGEDYLEKKWENSRPERYYNEVANLFRVGNPYDFKQRLRKIRTINKDKKFVSAVLKQPIKKLANMEKVSWVACLCRLPIITYLIFFLILKLRKEL
jgi:glycosyltransferase involved in cell wall biosynthesis